MLYILVCIVTILLLLPCVYSLPGFVYGRPASKLKFFRNMPPLWFWLLFAFGLAFYFAFFLTLLKSIAPLTARSVWLLIGCSIVFICAVFFVRLIPVYYDEHSDVQSRRRYVKSFWIETLWIAIFTAALETVSFHFYAYLVSGAVGAFLWGIRLRKVFALHKKYKAEDDDGD